MARPPSRSTPSIYPTTSRPTWPSSVLTLSVLHFPAYPTKPNQAYITINDIQSCILNPHSPFAGPPTPCHGHRSILRIRTIPLALKLAGTQFRPFEGFPGLQPNVVAPPSPPTHPHTPPRCRQRPNITLCRACGFCLLEYPLKGSALSRTFDRGP